MRAVTLLLSICILYHCEFWEWLFRWNEIVYRQIVCHSLTVVLHCVHFGLYPESQMTFGVMLFFLWFPCVGVRLVYWSLRSTATFVICFHWYMLLAFYLHFSSSSAFVRSLFTQFSHLNCGLPRFLKPACFFVSDIFGNLSYFILTMCPAHFIRLLTILPTIQALVPTSSLMSFILLLSTLFTPPILLIQLFSNTCSLCWCSSDMAYLHTSRNKMCMDYPDTFLPEKFRNHLNNMTNTWI